MASELMASALRRQRGYNVASIVRYAQDVLNVIKSTPVDILLIGANLADGALSGIAVLRHIREIAPDVKPIVLFSNQDDHLIVDAFRAGAKGVFIPSRADFKTLCRCIDRVNAGQVWASSMEILSVLCAFSQLSPICVMNTNGMRLLSKREEEVVRYVTEGLQNRDIARELNLSEHTIKNYLFRIYDKLGVSSRVELVMYAVSSAIRTPMVDVKIEGQATRLGTY
jgi:DNA-binding NarL/FixJ family response regulator